MRDNPLLIVILLALLIWLVWLWIKGEKRRGEKAARRKQEKRARQDEESARERENRARRDAEDAELRRKSTEADSAAWRVEVTEDRRKRKDEKEKDRREYQEERAKRLEQERRAQKEAMEAVSRRQEAEAAARRKVDAERADQLDEVDQTRRLLQEEREKVRSAVIASDIQRDMQNFLRGREFFGEDHSPLAYVGYKVGMTNGLPPMERRRRLKACFQIDIPQQLAAKYQAWGPPVTHHRLSSMRQHITMLAAMRRQRPNYDVAVRDWEADVVWLQEEYGNLAERLRRAGIR